MKRTNTTLSLLMLCALVCSGCIGVHTEQNTTTYTHAWWTGPAFFLLIPLSLIFGRWIWRRGDRIKSVGVVIVALIFAIGLGPKHVTEHVTISDRGFTSRLGTYWWQPELRDIAFNTLDDVLYDERQFLKKVKGEGKIEIRKSIELVQKQGEWISVPVNGLLRDSNADAEIVRRAAAAGVNIDPEKSVALKRQRAFVEKLEQQFFKSP